MPVHFSYAASLRPDGVGVLSLVVAKCRTLGSFTLVVLWHPHDKADRIQGTSLSPAAIYKTVAEYCEALGFDVAPHDLRRTFAKLSHKGKADLAQLSLSLGHDSLRTTQRYLGIELELDNAACDKHGIDDE